MKALAQVCGAQLLRDDIREGSRRLPADGWQEDGMRKASLQVHKSRHSRRIGTPFLYKLYTYIYIYA